jgi:proteasome assembly chaperone (PAC2) family protein
VALYELIERPELGSPVLVLAVDGWIDAGLGAQTARQHLLDQVDSVTVATFDADGLLDHRARRPAMVLQDGVLASLTWPSIELRAASDAAGNDLLLLTGAEPDHQWRAFTRAVVELALELDTRMVVGLGAYPAPVPHTRPARLAASASSEELAAFCAVRTSVEVPAGIQAAIERRAAEVGLPAIGLWAQVPHYASAMPAPGAAHSLLDGLARLAGLTIDLAGLSAASERTRVRIDELVAANPEHVAMVRQLEEQWDGEGGVSGLGLTGNIPSGDELAAEVERFLRDQS